MSNSTGSSPSATFATVVLDVAPAYRSLPEQDTVSDLILHLLERGYQIFLCSTTALEQFQSESFAQPGLRLIPEAMPPGEDLLRREPALTAPTTLWVTDNPALQEWIRQAGLSFAFPELRAVSFQPDAAIGTMQELAALLDPTAATLAEVARTVVAARERKGPGALLVGVGGAPGSGYQRFAVALKVELESQAAPLVELLDMEAFIAPADERGATPVDTQGHGAAGAQERGAAGAPWRNAAAGEWLMTTLINPLAAGNSVYLERRPTAAPRDFDAHFPLYLSNEAIVVILGEMLFMPPLRDRLDVTVLLELSPEETARRLFELPQGEPFDPKFTAQYLAGEGRVYREYLAAHHVVEGATLRIDANRPQAFFLRPPLRLSS